MCTNNPRRPLNIDELISELEESLSITIEDLPEEFLAEIPEEESLYDE